MGMLDLNTIISLTEHFAFGEKHELSKIEF